MKSMKVIRDSFPVALMLTASTLLVGYQSYAPRGGDAPVLAVFPPFDSFPEIFADAASRGLTVVGKSNLPFAVVIKPDGPASLRTLHRAGAWLVLDASGHGLCADNTSSGGS
jgi:hypothetical protein